MATLFGTLFGTRYGNSWKSPLFRGESNIDSEPSVKFVQSHSEPSVKVIQSHSSLPMDKTKVTFRQRHIEAFGHTFIEEWFVRGKTIKLNVYVMASDDSKYKFEIQVGNQELIGDVQAYGTGQNSMEFDDLEDVQSTLEYSITIKKC